MKKKNEVYLKIFEVLCDMQWHTKDEFVRPYSQDLTRLGDMHRKGLVSYEKRLTRNKDNEIMYSEYRLTEVYDAWWEYYKRYKDVTVVKLSVEGGE